MYIFLSPLIQNRQIWAHLFHHLKSLTVLKISSHLVHGNYASSLHQFKFVITCTVHPVLHTLLYIFELIPVSVRKNPAQIVKVVSVSYESQQQLSKYSIEVCISLRSFTAFSDYHHDSFFLKHISPPIALRRLGQLLAIAHGALQFALWCINCFVCINFHCGLQCDRAE